MSFGRNPDDLNKVKPFNNNDFERNLTKINENRNTRQQNRGNKGGGGGRRFHNLYRPTLEGTDTIHLIPGSYDYLLGKLDGTTESIPLEYLPFIEHFNATNKRSSICSGGPHHDNRKLRSPCVGCEKFFGGFSQELDANGRRKRGPVSKREMVAFGVLHFAGYHKLPSLNQDGSVRTNDRGEAYHHWGLCEGRGCVHCKAHIEKIDVNRMHWPMGTSHHNMLVKEFQSIIRNSCRNCKGKSTISTAAWLCSNETCGEAIIDMATTELNDQQIKEMVEVQITCPHCHTQDYLMEVCVCEGCANPQRASIFDVKMRVKRAKTGDGEGTVLSLLDHEVQPLTELPPELALPLDLTPLYAPDNLERQAQVFESRDDVPARPGARSYSNPR